MLHHMKLQPEAFQQVRRGEKTVELRLNDPKRQKIQVGDQIEFLNLQDKLQKLRVRVTDLRRAEMDCGGTYSREDLEKYGVIAMEFERLDWRDPQLVKTSRYLSLLLRHKPEAAGLTLDAHGWASVPALLEAVGRTHPLNMALLEQIVETDEKQRYSFNQDKTLIRANQGHSVSVDVELEAMEPPERLWHGTGKKYVDSIDVQGLVSKTRLYVHLSPDHETAVAVGRRHGEPVVYTVNAGQMHRDGYVFYQSVNHVWLTERVPRSYLRKEEK